MRHPTFRQWMLLIAAVVALVPSLVSAASQAYVGPFHTVSEIASTVPANGDVNPYGVAVIPATTGALVKGDILVSNFNNSANLQGTGKTIVEISPSGSTRLFAHISPAQVAGECPGGVGLTTALVVLRNGWVIVGSLPTSDGTAATAKAGCLIVLNNQGTVAETFFGAPINGPWDMTAQDNGATAQLFVTNVLNGTVAANGAVVNKGTIVRINLSIPDTGNPTVLSETIIGSGFGERTDPAALVIGPTGVGLGSSGALYIADTLANRIAVIPDALTRGTSAGTGQTVSTNGSLKGPLGLAIAPNGDILTVNAGNGKLVETTPGGTQVAVRVLDSSAVPGGAAGAGTLFGVAVAPNGVYFVDDGSNTFNLLH